MGAFLFVLLLIAGSAFGMEDKAGEALLGGLKGSVAREKRQAKFVASPPIMRKGFDLAKHPDVMLHRRAFAKPRHRMPTVRPDPAINYKILVSRPDLSVEYKLHRIPTDRHRGRRNIQAKGQGVSPLPPCRLQGGPELKSFEYVAPTSLEEATQFLSEHRGTAKLLAGGTDLIVRMKERTMTPEYLLDLKRIPGLEGISWDEKAGLRIGALTAVRSVERSDPIEGKFPMLAEGAGVIGSVQVRNRATIGGNLSNASPSADTAPPLLCLNARMKIAGSEGERTVPLDEFFVGPGQTVLSEDEILTEIQVPPSPSRTGGAYTRHTTRRAMDIAVVGAGAQVTLRPGDSVCDDVRIALGSVAPIPLRAHKAEEFLRGRGLTDELLQQAGEIAAEETRPIDDVRGSAWFRTEIVKVLVRRMLKCAWERAEARD